MSGLTLTASGTLWWQPENMNFTTNKSFVGCVFSLGFNIYPFSKNENSKYEFGINMNLLYETKDFMQEMMSLNEDLCFTAGVCLRY